MRRSGTSRAHEQVVIVFRHRGRHDAAQDLHELRGPHTGLRGRVDRARRGALRDGPGEQPLGRRRGEQGDDGVPACRLPEHGHVAGVAAELGDVVLHPAQHGDLVAQSEVALDRALRGRVPREVEVAERPQPVVEAHVDGAVRQHEALALARELLRGALGVAAAVDEHHHGQRTGDLGRHLHVDGQAVLIGREGCGRTPQTPPKRLRRLGTEPRRVADPLPRHHRSRSPEPQLPHRGRGVRDPPPRVDLALVNTDDVAAGHAHVQLRLPLAECVHPGTSSPAQ